MNQLPETTKKAFTEILKSREHASFELEKDSVLMTCGKLQLRLTKDMLKQQDDKENTLLHLTLEKCRADTNKANALALLEQLVLLSDAEIVNIQNGSCETALHHAVIYFPNNIKLTNLLLERGADPNLTDSQSKTPLHHVATCPVDSYFELGKLLLEHKAELAISDKDGNTPLHIVARNIQMADIDEDISKFAELLLSGAKGVNTRNNEGNTPLHLAAIADNALLATLLLRHNADLSIKNRRGRTALDLAILYSNARHEEATALLENGGKKLPLPGPKPEFPMVIKRKGTPLFFLLRDEKKHAASIATNTFPNNPDENTFLRVNYTNTDFAQALLTKEMELKDLKKALTRAKNPAMIKLLTSKIPVDPLKANIANHEDITALKNKPKQIAEECMPDLSNEENVLSSSSSTTTEDIIEESSEENGDEISTKILIKNKFFNKDKWNMESQKSDFSYLNAHPEISNTLNQIAAYARHHLDHKLDTARTLQGRAKYNQLAELMFDLQVIEAYDDQEKLMAARDLIRQRLDEGTKKSELLKNRGGFFGAYQKISSLLNKFGAKHYEYDHRTAVSRTDHYLIKLYDEINSKIVQQENIVN